MDKKKRRDLGAHYTSERSIIRLIKSLFLDDLQAEFAALKARRDTRKGKALDEFHAKLAKMRLLDPACGCGNFLVIAYRELRLLELEVIKEILATKQDDRQMVTDVRLLVRVDVHQFGGIEVEEWPARIAETALWLTDHQANRKLEEIGQVFERLPLKATPRIVVDNALSLDWGTIFPKGNLTYILGNPPFRGKQHQDTKQKADMKLMFGKSSGVLDYVAAWYWKAAAFIKGTDIQCAFVSTNSVAQGEQVAPLWRALAPFEVKRTFAHQYFDWDSEGKGKAGVYVVIVGFANADRARKHVVVYDDIKADGHIMVCNSINAYLVPDGANVFVEKRREPITPTAPKIAFGNMANEARAKGDTRPMFFFDSREEYEDFLAGEPNAKPWIKPFVGSDELIGGKERWCLWLKDAEPSELKALPHVRKRTDMVRENRERSTREETKCLALTPHLFGEIRQPKKRYLAIPRHSSENRDIIPFAFLGPEIIIGDACAFIEDADLYTFGVLESAMHMAWVRAVGGRLEGRYRYSNKLVYNTFPWPADVPALRKKAVETAAQDVLDARDNHPGETLENLYTNGLMPRDLVKAHQRLDAAVDACYSQQFKAENGRLRFLFETYQSMLGGGQAELLPKTEEKRPKQKRRNKVNEALI